MADIGIEVGVADIGRLGGAGLRARRPLRMKWRTSGPEAAADEMADIRAGGRGG
jgi:hypothetical protein